MEPKLIYGSFSSVAAPERNDIFPKLILLLN